MIFFHGRQSCIDYIVTDISCEADHWARFDDETEMALALLSTCVMQDAWFC